MTLDEFIKFRNTRIKNNDHKRIVKLFYPYLQSVTGDSSLLPALLEKIIDIDLNDTLVATGCFNGVNDNSTAPYNDVDFYIKLDNGIRIFVYGRVIKETIVLNEDEYVIFCTSDEIPDSIYKRENRHIYL